MSDIIQVRIDEVVENVAVTLAVTNEEIRVPIAEAPAGKDSEVPGPQGKSAYQVALDNGFSGTEQEWLDSLEGPPGTTTWDGITNKPEAFPPQSHGHEMGDVNGLQEALAGKASSDGVDSALESINMTLAAKANSSAVAAALDYKADATATATALSGKSDTGHTHAYSSLTGLPPPLRISMTEPADAACLWIQTDALGNPVSLWLKSA